MVGSVGNRYPRGWFPSLSLGVGAISGGCEKISNEQGAEPHVEALWDLKDMHEYSIVQALLDRVEAEARSHEATLVYRVRVRIGELAGVEPELLHSAFELVRESTMCAGAELEIVPSAAIWECRDCGTSISRGAVLRCRTCEGPARLASGDEILLEQIEMEAA